MYTAEEVKSWLKPALKCDFSVTCVRPSEKGEGYMGDILFVQTSGALHLDLVLKCSKRSQQLRQTLPVQHCFENEIHFYDTILPAFARFQRSKNVSAFDSVPEYFGSFTSDNFEVVILENLKSSGFQLHDKTKALSRDRLELVLKEYGKFHAISAVMQAQDANFSKLVNGVLNVWEEFAEKTDAVQFFGAPIDEICDVLSPELAEKLRQFKAQINYILKDLRNAESFKVVTHGDCWSNNFMFKGSEVKILDWQTARFCNPAADLSYFIYACASEADLGEFGDLLKVYYRSFCEFGQLLGCDLGASYGFDQFVGDFKVFGKYGLLITLLAVKVALSKKEEAPDFAETAADFGNTFGYKNRNQKELKERISYVVAHAAGFNIL
ncbi:hypothetical protein TcasGA2_TC009659 [Tribolium castaneum]|uniref:CHK kinase-like domain-containing protein n=1 Tax=Tribolium castaneum TaxID=7070 RepID=D6WTH7_TRICA|nr:PREDICTED: uncharacterized protein LOC663256 [Tribolium castaneum]EFA06728.1 hypothetical protein TcasGA2_TC009659 [Tribolium castaneum]|eukprot:XP_974405.1 PREDICTED: uncharacterized protein LOC663256 [Tribolium castaneum]